MKYRKSLLIVLLVLLVINLVGCEKNLDHKEPLTRTDFLMDTVITLKIYNRQDEEVLDKAIDRLKEIENKMSVTLASSHVSKINENAGTRPVKVDEEVYRVIKKAKEFAYITKGAYDPTIGPLVELWNIRDDVKLERESIPSPEEIKEAQELVDYRDLELLEDNRVFLNRKGMKIDLGGIAKGYAADEVRKVFLEEGVQSAIIDLGGDVYLMGEKDLKDYWKIGIQDPFKANGNYLGILKIKDKSIVTSGSYERYFVHKGHKYHHIIDPKTGYPAKGNLMAVSIISNESIEGDALATALFITGINTGLDIIGQLDGVEAIFITENREIFMDKNLIKDFSLTDPSFKIMDRLNK